MDAELYYITKSGDLHRLRQLYDANPEFLLQVTPQLNTALHLAARFGHLDVISEIYGRHPSLLVQANAKGDTPLHVAARAGNGRAVELLLNCAKGTANLGGEDGRSEGCGLLGMRNKENSTALLEAVRRGHRNTAVRLIEAGPELLSAVDDAGESPLYVAAENGMLEVVEHILSASSSSAAHGGPNGRTPLHAAAIKGHLDVTKVLLKNCSKLAKQVDADGRIPLHFAASLGNFDMVFCLLHLDTSTTYLLDKYGRAPIHMAAGNGHTKIVRELIHSCPDCSELLDARGRNILHLAVEKEKLDVVEYILESPHLDDLINERDNKGNSPLHLATINRNLSIVYLLATHECINTSIMNNDGLTAIDIVELVCDPSMRICKSTGSFFHDRSTTLGSLMGVTFPAIPGRVSSRRENSAVSGRGSAGRGERPRTERRRNHGRWWWWRLCREESRATSLAEFLEIERRCSDASERRYLYGEAPAGGNGLFADGRVLPPPAHAAAESPAGTACRITGICCGGGG